MFDTMAGRLSLQQLVTNTIEEVREKLASSEGKDEKKEDKVKKLLKYEKKEHGHIPTPKEEEAEKKASAIDFGDPEEIEKLASALDMVGDQLIKEAGDKIDHGGEYKGGGESLPVMAPVSGKQSYGKDSSKSHNVPMSTSSQKGDGGGPAPTQVQNDHAKRPGGAPYSKKGVMKTASSEVLARIRAMAGVKEDEVEETEEEEKVAEFPPAKDEKKDDGKEEKGEKKAPIHLFGKKDDKKGEEKKDDKDKKASVDFILNKIANTEKRMGGMTLDSKSGEGVKVPTGGTNSARSMIASNAAATDAKKVQAKAPQKKLMSEVLTEPMQSKAHDHKVSENLRNASKGGVKIAEVSRELLKKIAAEGCTCDGKGECKHCKMKKAMEKKSMGGMPATGASGAGSSMPTGPML